MDQEGWGLCTPQPSCSCPHSHFCLPPPAQTQTPLISVSLPNKTFKAKPIITIPISLYRSGNGDDLSKRLRSLRRGGEPPYLENLRKGLSRALSPSRRQVHCIDRPFSL
jgi:hypothetical protein